MRNLSLLFYFSGDLTAENFFKEVKKEDYNAHKTSLVMDNILIKMDAIFISRAVVNLNGTIIVQVLIVSVNVGIPTL